jgi:hypothetical protein
MTHKGARQGPDHPMLLVAVTCIVHAPEHLERSVASQGQHCIFSVGRAEGTRGENDNEVRKNVGPREVRYRRRMKRKLSRQRRKLRLQKGIIHETECANRKGRIKERKGGGWHYIFKVYVLYLLSISECPKQIGIFVYLYPKTPI